MRIEVRWIRHRLLNRIGSDLMQQNAMDLAIDVFSQSLPDMPGNCLTLPVRVGRQVNIFLTFGCFFDAFDDLNFGRNHMVLGLEVLLDVDPQLALGEIDDMAHGRCDLIGGPQIPLNRPGLGGGFYNYEVFCHSMDSSGAGCLVVISDTIVTDSSRRGKLARYG